MLIPIITNCKEPDSVPPHVLDMMLSNGEIHAFERSNGWAVVGRDPIRAVSRPYYGTERRRSVAFRPAASLAV
ncbi:MAG TPA: hypothetical protein HPP76_09690 [Desulfuromonadales bacterium]|nr:hypothetical protein [Desulfuromonadales bacterium]